MKITVVSEQGKEAVVAILGANEFFGEGCLAGQVQRIATVATMTDSVIVRLEKASIVRVIHQEPAFSEMFIAHLVGRGIRVEADLVDQLFNSSEKRLARLLLLLANFGKEGKPEPIIAKISQETLAEMIGTTRSRVSFFMNKFRKLGFIHYNGHIEVHSSLLNVVLHDEPKIETLNVLALPTCGHVDTVRGPHYVRCEQYRWDVSNFAQSSPLIWRRFCSQLKLGDGLKCGCASEALAATACGSEAPADPRRLLSFVRRLSVDLP